jgi:nucleoid-associated protein YgaU
MSGIAASLRFVVGLAMVAGGTALVSPLAVRIAATVRHHATPTAPLGVMSHTEDPTAVTAAAIDPAIAPAPMAGQAFDMPPEGMPATPGPPLQADYRPPPPPTPLPPLPVEFALPNAPLAGAYRSTLDVPPPPLLDSQGPPPLAATWTAHGPPQPTAAAFVSAAAVPATYRVRDGDDLAGIAARFYGHPAAAAAVWAANREVATDPGLLPIGAVLRLPPPDAVRAWGAVATGGGIEPAHAPAPTPVAGRVTATPVSASAPPSPWLGEAGASGGLPPAVAKPAPAGPRLVRLAPGETLETLARRFYGDASQAQRIWEANRDRLRSPELVVSGMELRLP